MKIPQEIIDIISKGETSKNWYKLPDIQLDRKMYKIVNDVLESIGLKWSRKNKRHESIKNNIKECLDEILQNGETETLSEIKKKFQFFETPKELVKKIIELAKIKENDVVLEPSAGKGAIIKQIPKCRKIVAIELKEENCDYLRKEFFNITIEQYDFLEYKTETKYNKIVMNPPFSKSQDVKHILHAYSMLSEGGILISVASSSVKTRDNKIYQELRELNPEFIELESGSFKESGTMVSTIIVKLKK